MKTIKMCLAGIIMGWMLTGCVQSAGQANVETAGQSTLMDRSELFVACPSTRPQMCTREFRPVCAEMVVYCIQAPCPAEYRTFANGCEACSRDGVVGYVPGPCGEPSDGLNHSSGSDYVR